MKHFFYAVYVLFYTGAVFMAGVFIGQYLYRSRSLRQRRPDAMAWLPDGGSNGKSTLGEPKVAMTGKRH